ncbi:MAG: helix-turn-helix transcriptional regulator [Cyanobacteria bacterium P01_A01_bin.84]
MNFNQAFDTTLKEFKINAKQLAEKSGITPQSISDFRRGKKNIQTDSLEKLLEFLPIEARIYFFSLLLGKGILAGHLVAGMNNEQMSDVMMAIANKIKSNSKKNNSKNTNQGSIKETIKLS